MSKRRVVVTGLGAVTPIGNNVKDFWAGIREGKVGIGPITKFDTTDYKVKIAAEVKDFNAKDHMDPRSARRMDPFCQYAVTAAKEALEDSGIDMEKEDSIAFLEQSFDTEETIWCIAAGGTIVGLVLTSIQPDQTNLYGLAIHPEYQGKGYGRDAVNVLLQKPEITFPVTLHVTEENEAAFKIYKGMGFVTTQELMEYWY